MTLHNTVSPLLPVDNTTALVAASVNVPILTITDAYDNHINGSADSHATSAITDAALTGTVAITNASTTEFNRIRQLTSALIAVSGVATTDFALAMSTLPATLTSINAVLVAATSINTVSTLVKRDASGDFSARDVTVRNVIASGTGTFTGAVTGASFTGTVATTNLSGTLAAAQEPAHTGDVTNTAGSLAMTVAFVGTKSAAAIAQSVVDTIAATSANTFSTIVKRGAAGQVVVGALTADSITLSGTVQTTGETITGNLTVHGNLVLDTGTISGPLNVTAATGVMPQASDPALTGDVTKAAGNAATTVAFIATKTAAAVAQAVVDTIAATNVNTISTIVKRDGSGDFAARDVTGRAFIGSGALSGTTGTFSGAVSGASFTGIVATTNLSGVLAAAQFPAMTGDVTNTAGALATVVAFVGTKSAAAIAQSVTDTVAATNTNTFSTLVKRDGSGNFAGQIITGVTFVGALTGNVTGYATGVNGLTSGALLLGAGVGVNATAFVGSANGQVVQWNAASSSWVASSTSVASYSLTLTQSAGGAVVPVGGNLSVTVGATNDAAIDGTYAPYPGETKDLTSYRPGSPGNSVWILLYLNGTGTLRVQQGVEAAAPTKPLMQAYTKPLAYVNLAYAQTVVASGNITDARVDYQTFLGAGGTGSGVFAPLAHIHGSGGTALVPYTGLDEGLVTTPATPGFSIVVQPCTYTDAAGLSQRSLQQALACNTAPVTNSRYDTVGITNTGSAYIRMGTEAASPLKVTTTNATDILLAYILMRPGKSVTELSDAGNDVIIDARRIFAINQPSAQGSSALVSGGGTGQTTFTAGSLYTTGGTNSFLTTPMTVQTTGTIGVNQNPSLIISPAGSNSELHRFGGGTFTTGGTGSTKLDAVHIVAPTITGGGTQATVYTLEVDAAAGGTVNRSIYAAGAVEIIGVLVASGGGTLTGTFAGAHTLSGAVTLTGDVITAKIGTASGTGQLTIPAATSDTIALVALAQTLTNKTLTNPTINAASLSGTMSGAVTLSGAVTFSAAGTALSVTNNATISGTTTLGSLAGILFGTAGVVSALNVTAKRLLVSQGTSAPTGLTVPAATSFIGSDGTDFATRTAAQTRTDLNLNYYFSAARIGTPVASEEVDRFGVPFAMTLPALMAGSVARSETVSTAQTDIDVQRSAAGGAFASVGTVRFANAAKVATFLTTGSALVNLAADDRIKLVAPAAWNGLTSLTIDIIGTY